MSVVARTLRGMANFAVRLGPRPRLGLLAPDPGAGPRPRRPPGAAGRPPAARQAGTGSHTVARARCSRAGSAAPGQILADGGQVSAWFPAAERRQALGDARDGVGVTEDFQGHLHAFEVVHGQQDGLSFAVAGQGDPLVLQAHPPGQLRQPSLGLGWGPQADDESIAAIHRALELGVNWIDTAAAYGFGRSEEIVGRALAGLPERPYVFAMNSLLDDGTRHVRHVLRRDAILA